MNRRSFLTGLAGTLAASLTGRAGWALESRVLLAGTFQGQSGHDVRGGVEIVARGTERLFILGADFVLDGAPTPTLGFSRNGSFLPETEFAPLRALEGRQVYRLPGDLDLSTVDTATVWCTDFAVPLGRAPLG